MRITRRALLGATTATFALSGCTTSDDTGNSTTTEAETDTTTAAETQTDMAAADVQVSSHPDHGDILVDSEGMALYMFDKDTEGEEASTCYDDCAQNWPPLTVEETPTAGDGVTAELTTFERDDGTMQVSAGGWPLYYFTPDENPGDVKGQGAGDVWWLLRPDGTPVKPAAKADVQVSSHPDHGDILVGPDEMTLYMFDKDTEGEKASTCYDGCAESWPPLTVEDTPAAGESVTAELTTFERDDGTMQVSAGGWPLYYFAPDENPGDVKGQGANDIWWVLTPDGTPIKPESTTSANVGSGYY